MIADVHALIDKLRRLSNGSTPASNADLAGRILIEAVRLGVFAGVKFFEFRVIMDRARSVVANSSSPFPGIPAFVDGVRWFRENATECFPSQSKPNFYAGHFQGDLRSGDRKFLRVNVPIVADLIELWAPHKTPKPTAHRDPPKPTTEKVGPGASAATKQRGKRGRKSKWVDLNSLICSETMEGKPDDEIATTYRQRFSCRPESKEVNAKKVQEVRDNYRRREQDHDSAAVE